MSGVIIGVDPHKVPATIEVLGEGEQVLKTGRFGTDRAGYQAMLSAGRAWPERTWAVEGCQGIGRHVAQRLVADGETVVDVPAKLPARARVFSTGQGRKTDATDAHSIAVVAARTTALRPVAREDELMALRLLADRREELANARTQAVSRLHRLPGLIPGGAPRFLSAAQARALLATVRPREIAGRTRRQIAAELLAGIVVLDRKLKDSDKALRQAVAATGTAPMNLHGLGPVGAARVLSDVADVTRFPTRAHFASWNGTAPIDAPSGEQIRHRLSRAGNRRINRVLHIMAIVQPRNDTEGRACFRRKVAAGKTKMEALRCLKRRLSDVLYRQLAAEAKTADPAQQVPAGPMETGPGGHVGAATKSSAAGLNPMTGSSDKSLPGPVNSNATPSRQISRTPCLT